MHRNRQPFHCWVLSAGCLNRQQLANSSMSQYQVCCHYRWISPAAAPWCLPVKTVSESNARRHFLWSVRALSVLSLACLCAGCLFIIHLGSVMIERATPAPCFHVIQHPHCVWWLWNVACGLQDFSGDFADLDGVVQKRRQEMMESSSSGSQTPDYDKIGVLLPSVCIQLLCAQSNQQYTVCSY